MKIIIAQNDALMLDFIKMPLSIYKGDKNYIRPLDKDIKSVFNKEENKTFKTGECEAWLLEQNGTYIGRIAVFVNKKYKQDIPTGGFGFFECINDQTAADFLLNAAKDWLQKRGMVAMDGPINFGERDNWWGLQIGGYQEPLYKMNYNPVYYKALLENFGMEIYYNQLCFGINRDDQYDPKFDRIAALYEKRSDITAKHMDKNNLDKFAEDFVIIYNKAFAGHGEGKTMDIRVAKKTFATMKPVMDEKISWFAYHNDEPVAMWLNLPDLNQYFKHFNGKLGLIEKLRFLYMQKFMKVDRFLGVVYGIVPEWQGKGVDAFMIGECRKYVVSTKAYNYFEMQWIGDFNPKMINLASSLNAKEIRRLATYRFLFDRTIPFQRMRILR
jgi:hypothetical protein